MKRHSTDLVSLAFGLVFAGIAAWWLIGRYILDVHLDVPNLGLIMAGALIVLGLLGVIGSLRREPRSATPTTGAPAPTLDPGAEEPTVIAPLVDTPDPTWRDPEPADKDPEPAHKDPEPADRDPEPDGNDTVDARDVAGGDTVEPEERDTDPPSERDNRPY